MEKREGKKTVGITKSSDIFKLTLLLALSSADFESWLSKAVFVYFSQSLYLCPRCHVVWRTHFDMGSVG